MQKGLTLILVGHINFILGAIVHGSVLRHISKPNQHITTEYTVANIISVTSGLLVSQLLVRQLDIIHPLFLYQICSVYYVLKVCRTFKTNQSRYISQDFFLPAITILNSCDFVFLCIRTTHMYSPTVKIKSGLHCTSVQCCVFFAAIKTELAYYKGAGFSNSFSSCSRASFITLRYQINWQLLMMRWC